MPLGDGKLGGWYDASPDVFVDYPLPACTYDKMVVGLVDAHRLCGNRDALTILGRVANAVLRVLPGRALDRRVVERQAYVTSAVGRDETCTQPENLYLAAEVGGDCDEGSMVAHGSSKTLG